MAGSCQHCHSVFRVYAFACLHTAVNELSCIAGAARCVIVTVVVTGLLPEAGDLPTCPVDRECLLRELLVWADVYMVPFVTCWCERMLAPLVNEATCCRILAMASRHKADQLQELCIHKAASLFSIVKVSGGFKALPQEMAAAIAEKAAQLVGEGAE